MGCQLKIDIRAGLQVIRYDCLNTETRYAQEKSKIINFHNIDKLRKNGNRVVLF